jgi:MFS family permease
VIGSQTGWSTTGTTAAFTAALVASAVAGVAVGRWLDRHGPRRLMTSGSLLAAAALGLIGWSPTLGWFCGGWLLAGLAMGATLYPPAFAAVTRWYGPRRVQALTVLTLAGGLASTAFAPVTAMLADRLGWRAAFLVLAAVVAVITVPAHWFGLRPAWPPAPVVTRAEERPTSVARSRAFLALAVALSLGALAEYAVVVSLVPLMTERGMGLTAAAVLLGASGAAQLLGRLGYPLLSRLVPVRARTVSVLVGVALTTAMLAVLTSTAAVVVAVAAGGALRGAQTLIHATAISDRWGTSHYGRLTGLLSAPIVLAAAVAPWLGAVLAARLGGYATTYLVLAGVAGLAAVAGLWSLPPPTGAPRSTDAPATTGARG